MFHIDGVDIEKGIAMSGGTIDLYVGVATAFCSDGVERISEINKCLEEGNISLYTTHVHGLKSALRIIGAENLSKTALELELAGKQGNIDYIYENNEAFLNDLQAILESMNKVLSTSGEEPHFDKEELMEQLALLRTALGEFDIFTANKAVNGLLLLTQGTDTHAMIREISKNILLCEYDEAITLINRFNL